MSTSGSLTAEQRRKIEENRRKALAKRALKSSLSPVKSNDNPITWQKSTNAASKNSSNYSSQQPTSSWQGKTSSYGSCSQGSCQNFSGIKGNQHNQHSSIQRNTLSNQINKHSAQALDNQNASGVSTNQNTSNSSTGTYKPYAANQPSSSSTNSTYKPYDNNNASCVKPTTTTNTTGGVYKPFNCAEGLSNTNSASSTNRPYCATSSTQGVPNTNNASNTNITLDGQATSSTKIVVSVNKPFSAQGAPSTNSAPSNSAQTTASQFANKPVNMFMGNVKPVKGQCILISRERFEVKVGFSQPLIELFKRMQTKLYDAVTKKWSFKLEDYDTFMREALVLKPHVIIEPLPKAILQVFSLQLKGNYPSRDIPSADLSEVDVSLVSSLLPFQREGVNFGVSKKGRVLIADDMGLGKTIQAICLACYYRDDWPMLVIVPSSVRFDWAQQIRRWLPSIDPQEISVAVTGKDSSSSQINIVTYDLVARKAKYLQEKRFQVVVVDECHLLKNYKTARCKAAMPILQNARRVILLSGTPALSRPSELYTQISAITPFLFKYQDFGVRYCDGKQQQWGWDFSGSSNMAELQILLEERIMIRRLKKNVLTQLPSKVRQMVLLDSSAIKSTKDLKKASKVMDLKSLKGMERRGALLEYFHHTSTAKVQAVKDYLQDLFEADRKFLLFAHHQEFLDSIEELARSKLGNNYIRIDGKTSAEQRNFNCRKFQENPDYKVAILSITAANAGINLSAASLVVFGELFWNPGILVQAEDRAHRMGQQDMVNVQYLVAQNTADDQIWPLVQKKLEVLNKAGLSKDNFSEADTTRHKDSKQSDLMQFFEESFIEEDDSFIAENTMECEDQETSKTVMPQCEPKKKEKNGSLFSYFSSKKTSQPGRDDNTDLKGGNSLSVNKGDNQDHFEGDDLDLVMDDDEWNDPGFEEPQQKKFRS